MYIRGIGLRQGLDIDYNLVYFKATLPWVEVVVAVRGKLWPSAIEAMPG